MHQYIDVGRPLAAVVATNLSNYSLTINSNCNPKMGSVHAPSGVATMWASKDHDRRDRAQPASQRLLLVSVCGVYLKNQAHCCHMRHPEITARGHCRRRYILTAVPTEHITHHHQTTTPIKQRFACDYPQPTYISTDHPLSIVPAVRSEHTSYHTPQSHDYSKKEAICMQSPAARIYSIHPSPVYLHCCSFRTYHTQWSSYDSNKEAIYATTVKCQSPFCSCLSSLPFLPNVSLTVIKVLLQ